MKHVDVCGPAWIAELGAGACVRNWRVADGDRVACGDLIAELEVAGQRRMVVAPQDGTVRGLRVAAGDRVDAGQPLCGLDCDSPMPARQFNPSGPPPRRGGFPAG